MYPDLSITVSFDEESGAFAGEIEMKKGEMEYYNDLRMSETGEE
jgi:hypothetical protein